MKKLKSVKLMDQLKIFFIKNSIGGILSIVLLCILSITIPNTSAAQSTNEKYLPVSGADLEAVMKWIGQETSRADVDFCWKDTYSRETYSSKNQCEAKEGSECVQLGLLWYVRCLPGYETSVVPQCLAKCPSYEAVLAGAPNVKRDCGLACSLGNDQCAEGVMDMVFSPIFLTMNIVSFGLSGAARKSAQQAALAGANAATGGAAQASAGITKTALAGDKWTKLLNALDKAEEVFDVVVDTKDKVEYVQQIADDLETELNRWTTFWSEDKNFKELTSYRINAEINKRFPNDYQNIKAAYGEYQLRTMLEADGWRIAKTVLSHASNLDPLGVLETINAFAHPVCNLEATPFPNIKILTEKEVILKNTPIVKFYPKDGITFEEAKNIAEQNGWVIATSQNILNNFRYREFDVPHIGWRDNGYGHGSFVLPTQVGAYKDRGIIRTPNQGPGGESGNTVADGEGFFYSPKDEPNVTPVNESDIELMWRSSRARSQEAGKYGAKHGFTTRGAQKLAKEAADFAELAAEFEAGYFGDASAQTVLSAVSANTHMDAALYHHGDQFSYFFQGNQYYRFKGTKADINYPMTLPGHWKGLPESFSGGIDAAVYNTVDSKTYFFKGDEYVSIAGATVESGYPKKINQGWSGLPAHFQRGIDAAILRTGKIYFFKGDQYVRITDSKVESGYPKTIKSAWSFPSAFNSGIDAAIGHKPNSKNYVFKEEKYARLSDTRLDAGYPLALPGGWTGLLKGKPVAILVKDIKFYPHNDITLEEAKKIASLNDLKLASRSDIAAAFKYRHLNVYAFGMMADGHFAVPVQNKHSNFEAGPNIGATGGNQGFFYITKPRVKEVKFHNQNGISFAEAQNLARQNSWAIATADEVLDAWTYKNLNVYAFGMMADGRFAVPLQSDTPNFKKGHNIGATGGNQGFFYTSTNIALYKPAKQSSIYSNSDKYAAKFANDGRIEEQNKGGEYIAATQQENNPWWEVDLKSIYTIKEIKLYNRINGNPERLANFTILVSERPFTGNKGGTVFTQKQPAPPGKNGTGSYSGNATGRYVRLFIEGNMLMSIPEIEIFGEFSAPAKTYASIQIEDGLHNKVLIGGDTYNGRIHHQDANNRANAKWTFESTGDGYYYIIDVKHNMALVAGDNADNGVYHQDPNGRDNAKWKLEAVGDGTFHITDKKHSKSLIAGTSYDGNVYHQAPQGRKNATWLLTVVGEETGIKPGELTANTTKITFKNRAGYTARYTLDYTIQGKRVTLSSGNITLGRDKVFDVPRVATDVYIKAEGHTGLPGSAGWRTHFENTYPTASDITIESKGTTLGQSAIEY